MRIPGFLSFLVRPSPRRTGRGGTRRAQRIALRGGFPDRRSSLPARRGWEGVPGRGSSEGAIKSAAIVRIGPIGALLILSLAASPPARSEVGASTSGGFDDTLKLWFPPDAPKEAYL